MKCKSKVSILAVNDEALLAAGYVRQGKTILSQGEEGLTMVVIWARYKM